MPNDITSRFRRPTFATRYRQPLPLIRKRQKLPRIRKPIPYYAPPWEGVFENWAVKWVRKNFWRVQHVFATQEDALQECAVIFSKCIDRYCYKVDNAKWFMSLFTMAVIRYWNGAAMKDKQSRELIVYAHDEMPADAEDRTEATPSSVVYNEAPFMIALSELSAEVQAVIKILIEAPSEFITDMFARPADAEGDDLKWHRILNRRIRMRCGFSRRDDIDFLEQLEEIVKIPR